MKRKKVVSPICRKEKITSLSKKIRRLQSSFEPKEKHSQLRKLKMCNLTQRRARASNVAHKFPSSFQNLKIRRNVSFLNQTSKVPEPKKRTSAASKLKKFQSKSTKKKHTRSVNDYPNELKLAMGTKLASHQKSKQNKECSLAEDSVLIAQYQSLESKSVSEANSCQGKLGMSKTETSSFFGGKGKTCEDVKMRQNNIFYQNLNSRENNCQTQSGEIQFFNNQVNNIEIKISQHFLGQPQLRSLDKEKLLSSQSGEHVEKKVIFSNFNNHIEEAFSPNPPPRKKHKIKNLSLNLKGLYFDLPSMRNLKTSESGQYLPNESAHDDPTQHTRSHDSKGGLHQTSLALLSERFLWIFAASRNKLISLISRRASTIFADAACADCSC